jgi:hypothetical protein
LKNCFWLLMLLYPGVCKKARTYWSLLAALGLTCIHVRQVMQLYGTRSLEGGTFLRADYGVRLAAAENTLRAPIHERSPRRPRSGRVIPRSTASSATSAMPLVRSLRI